MSLCKIIFFQNQSSQLDVGAQLIITRRIPRGGRRRGGVAVAVQGKWPDGGENPPHGEDLAPCMCALFHSELVLLCPSNFDCLLSCLILYIFVIPNQKWTDGGQNPLHPHSLTVALCALLHLEP